MELDGKEDLLVTPAGFEPATIVYFSIEIIMHKGNFRYSSDL